MVDLSYLEEREERARNEFSHVKKRWESRVSSIYIDIFLMIELKSPHLNCCFFFGTKRQDGMKGKGKLTQNRVGMRHVIHRASILDPAERNIVTYGNHIARRSFLEQDSRPREKSIAKNQNIQRRSKGLHGHSKSIQQPRKMN